jgi:hypothetical protein
MAAIQMKHKDSGMLKSVPVGISITVILFGFFVPLFRGDIKGALIGVLFAWLAWIPGNIIFSFIYNKMFINDLVAKGYIPADDFSKNILIQKGISFAN